LKGFVDDVLGSKPDVVSLFTNHPKMGELPTFNQALCGLYAAGYALVEEKPVEGSRIRINRRQKRRRSKRRSRKACGTSVGQQIGLAHMSSCHVVESVRPRRPLLRRTSSSRIWWRKRCSR
jgi:hypothetical protein